MKVGPPAAPDHQAIAGEGHATIVEDISQTTADMAGCRPDLQVALAESDRVVVDEVAVGFLGTAGRA